MMTNHLSSALGKIIWNRYKHGTRAHWTEWKNSPNYRVIKYQKLENNNHLFIVQNLKDPSDTKEMSDSEMFEDYLTIPPYRVQTRWDRFQKKSIREGVWMSVAEEELRNKVCSSLTLCLLIRFW